MKNRGSCGLKQARYETSWRLFAARCRLVQNSLTNVSTTIGLDLARPTLVIARVVGRPFHWKARSSRTISGRREGEAGSRWGAALISKVRQVRKVRRFVRFVGPT